jgi:hypothetical protein
MIAAYFSGRTGNQMFQYAFIRKLRQERDNKDDFVFNFSLVYSNAQESGYNDTLADLNVIPYQVNRCNLVLKYAGWVKFLYLLYKFCVDLAGAYIPFFRSTKNFWYKLLEKRGVIFKCYDDSISDIPKQSSKNIIVYGKFENSKYFDDIKGILKKEFTPKYPILEDNQHLYDVLEKKNSVCVHVRRGDFLSDAFKRDFYVCDKSYYMRAIDYIKCHVENPVFFFFSNDIEWVRKEMAIEGEKYYEPDNNPLWETFRMMYCCKHFIISNSTLSWWAQYLSRNENKIVVSPDHWYNNPEKSSKAHLIEPSFVKIPCVFHD